LNRYYDDIFITKYLLDAAEDYSLDTGTPIDDALFKLSVNYIIHETIHQSIAEVDGHKSGAAYDKLTGGWMSEDGTSYGGLGYEEGKLLP
jgi:hypothetical protein